jgi:PTS system beta-glucosides-specific IIC component
MNYKDLAQSILSAVGGKDNVINVMNCATRLRFQLKDLTKANQNEVKKINGVMVAQTKGEHFQVIIGTVVAYVCM